MKTISTFNVLALCFVLLTLVACKDEEDLIKKHYEGNWNFTSTSSDFDTTVTVFINSEGEFEYELDYGGDQITVDASVNKEGNVFGNISVSQNSLGGIDGKLNESGSGSGRYVVVNKVVLWSANKQ